MLRKLKNLCLRLMFRLADGPYMIRVHSEQEKEIIRKWMVSCYADPGYQLFTKYRQAKFTIKLSELGMEENPRDTYVRVIGQKFESLRVDDVMRQAFNNNSKRERKRNEAQQ